MAIPSPLRTAWSGEGFPRSLRKAGCCSWHVKKLVWQFSNRAGLLTSNHPPQITDPSRSEVRYLFL